MNVAGAGATLQFSQCSGSGSDATIYARGRVCSDATLFCSDAQLCLYVLYSQKFGTPTSHEPDVVETCGLRHFVALSCAKVMNISNFVISAREPQEGRKTHFT